MTPAPGDIIAERYELEHLLGEGSMGAVWSGKHRVTFKRVALKFLKDVGDPSLVQRFVREARAASAVRHPHVIQVHDVLETEHGLALVMDLLEGESLECRLERGGPLPLAELAQLMSKVVSALRAVHAAGVVHRDLKPDNIFLSRQSDGRVEPVLLDFGVCKLRSSHTAADRATPITRTGQVIGTPSYMAPEQIVAANEADARVDVWSLGVMLYECASGVVPFRGRSLPEVVTGILNAPITPLQELVPELPASFLDLVERLLTRDPERRPLDLSDTQATLQALRESRVPPPPAVLTQTRQTLPKRAALTKASAGGGWISTISGHNPASAAARPRGVSHHARLLLFGASMVLVGLLSTLLYSTSRRSPPLAASSVSSNAIADAPAPPTTPAPAPSTAPPAASSPAVSSNRPPETASVPQRPRPASPQGRVPVTNFGGRR